MTKQSGMGWALALAFLFCGSTGWAASTKPSKTPAASKSKAPAKKTSKKTPKKRAKSKPKAKPKAKATATPSPTPHAIVEATLGIEPSPAPTLEPAPTPDPHDESSFSVDEKALATEINKMRSDPKAYAEEVLVPLREAYKGKLFQGPGDSIPMRTKEGVAALEDCLGAMQGLEPLQPLALKWRLGEAAKDHLKDQGPKGDTGHRGSDGSSPFDRIKRYLPCFEEAGECLAFGNREPRKILVQLLVDDGVPGRGHRQLLLAPYFESIGIAIGPHKDYGHMAVLDFMKDCPKP